jgi:hypothetical protein
MNKKMFDATEEALSNFLLDQMLLAYPRGRELRAILASFKSDSAVSSSEKARLMADEMRLYAQRGFVFFLDGVDELGDKLPIHKLYDVSKWSQSYFVITARTGFFTDRYVGLSCLLCIFL